MTRERQAEARAARSEYMRKWRADHPEAVRAAQMRYWAKKAKEMSISITNIEENNDKETTGIRM